MAKFLIHAVALATLSRSIMAEPIAIPDPMITPAPIFQVKRQAIGSTFVGWYPESVVGNTTDCKSSKADCCRNQ